MSTRRRPARKARRRAWLLSGFLAAFVGAMASAQATEEGDDEVLLGDGSTVRGTVLAVESDRRVLVLEPGEVAPREIAWANVAKVTKGKYAEVRKVHVVSETPVELREELLDGSARVLCTSPCGRDVDVSPGRSYFLVGDDVPRAYFNPREGRGDLTLQVRPGSDVQWALGTGLLVAGGIGVSVGLSGPFAAAIRDEELAYEPWLITGIIGAHALGAGFALFLASQTTVESVPAARGQARAPRTWLGEL